MGKPVEGGQSRRPLAAIVLLGLIVRLLWGLHLPADEAGLAALPDQVEYLHIGQSVLNGQGLQFFDPRIKDVVRAYRMPGYPLLIAACDGRVMIIRIVQALLDASTILATFLLARHWLGEMGSLAAGVLVAVNPFLIYFSGLILSETLFTAMLVWGATLLVISDGPWPYQRSRQIGWLGGGFLIALSIMVRPNAIALPVLMGLSSVFIGPPMAGLPIYKPEPRRLHWWQPIGATFALMTIVVLIPWTVRNYDLLDSLEGRPFLWATTNEGITKYDGFNPSATGASDQRFVAGMAMRLRSMSEVDRSRYLSNLADESIRQTGWTDLAKLTVVKVARTWSPIPLSEMLAGRWWMVVTALCYTIPVSILVLVGLFGKVIPLSGRFFLLLTPAYFTLIVAMSVGSLRYRVPAEPMMAVVAASAVAKWTDRRRSGASHGSLSENAPREAVA
jgi:hypothetical protein